MRISHQKHILFLADNSNMSPSTEPVQELPSEAAPDLLEEERAADEAIIRSLCYSDIFGFPLKLEEIVRFSEMAGLSLELAADRLKNGKALHQIVKSAGEFFYLDGREGNCEIRRGRETESKRQLQIALRRLIPLQGIPFLRMAAITGALAALNSPAGDDVDLLIISSRGRIWTSYLFMRCWRYFGHNPDICFNVFLSEGDLVFRNENLFFAREILGSMPVFNRGAFEEFVAANPWIFEIFPSWIPDQERRSYKLDISPRWQRRQKRLETVLTGPLGDLLEFAARKLQSRILIGAAPDAALGVRRNRIKLHKHDNRSPILDKYDERCRERLTRYRELANQA